MNFQRSILIVLKTLSQQPYQIKLQQFRCSGCQPVEMLCGKEQPEVVMSIVGNITSGQVSGETAKQLYEKFGKIQRDRRSIVINRNDTGLSAMTLSILNE